MYVNFICNYFSMSSGLCLVDWFPYELRDDMVFKVLEDTVKQT